MFPRIFTEYCQPGGPLREFGVPEITSQAASIRFELLRQYQERNYGEPDAYIKQIPVLP